MGGTRTVPQPGEIRAFAFHVLHGVRGNPPQRQVAGAGTPPLTAPAPHMTPIGYRPFSSCAVASYIGPGCVVRRRHMRNFRPEAGFGRKPINSCRGGFGGSPSQLLRSALRDDLSKPLMKLIPCGLKRTCALAVGGNGLKSFE